MVQKESNGFPFPDQVEDRFHGNDTDVFIGLFAFLYYLLYNLRGGWYNGV